MMAMMPPLSLALSAEDVAMAQLNGNESRVLGCELFLWIGAHL